MDNTNIPPQGPVPQPVQNPIPTIIPRSPTQQQNQQSQAPMPPSKPLPIIHPYQPPVRILHGSRFHLSYKMIVVIVIIALVVVLYFTGILQNIWNQFNSIHSGGSKNTLVSGFSGVYSGFEPLQS
jgi:hypothetical protein